MSREKRKRGTLAESISRNLGRELGARTILFHQAVADRLGMTITEHKCLDYVCRGERVTAGELAGITGLTTGAITGMVDRLENAGFVRRARSDEDRRKVFIVPAGEKAFRDFGKIFGPLADDMDRLIDSYSDQQLETIQEFLIGVIEIMKSNTERIRKN